MSEIDELRERVEACRRRWAELRPIGWGPPGPPDPDTGERWDRGHVLGHVAEMLPFWTAQMRAVLSGAAEAGRAPEGERRRRESIDGAHAVGEEELLRRVGEGIAGLQRLLAEMVDTDLERPLTFRSHGGAEQLRLRDAMERLLIGHLEAHFRQLEELGTTS